MRTLLYVPIVHTESDLGHLGTGLDRSSASLLGEGRWSRHRQVVAEFWKTIEVYCAALDSRGLKIYQDGLPVEGELGRKIVEEAARRGSKNYQIILDLLNRGAELRKTEDPSLLLEEYELMTSLVAASSAPDRARDYASYRSRKERLTTERDRFIADRIDKSLKPGETGLLFVGTYHDVLSGLAQDIVVRPLKDPKKVSAYFEELLAGGDEKKFEQLARCLASPVED